MDCEIIERNREAEANAAHYRQASLPHRGGLQAVNSETSELRSKLRQEYRKQEKRDEVIIISVAFARKL